MIDHVYISVTDAEKSLAFYAAALKAQSLERRSLRNSTQPPHQPHAVYSKRELTFFRALAGRELGGVQ
jgi:catechol 2,3-dioxygenase-like lactoylglutathione lyase family enzyme